MKSIYTFALAGVSLAAFVGPESAIAQDTPAAAVEADTSASEIIVTARRRDESIQDVPAVINAVTGEEIANLNLRSFTEVQSLVPGLQLGTEASGTGGSARLRGVNFDVVASGNNPTVEFYLNDATIQAGVVLQQMYDVGQIEVLRGPQGTLRGRASPSGSITVTTRKPDLEEIGGYVQATGNDIGTINAQGGFGIPIIQGVAAIRVAGVWDEGDADRVRPITNVDGRDPYARTKSGRISALVEPSDWLRLEASYQHLDRLSRTYDQVESFSEVNPAAPASPVLIRAKDRLSNQEESRVVRQKYDIYNWRGEGALAGQKLIYQGAHYVQKLDGMENIDDGNFFIGRDISNLNSTRGKSTSHEIRLQNEERVAGMFDYVIGYFDSKNDIPSILQRPTIIRLPVAFGGGIAALVNTEVVRLGVSHEKSFFGNLTAHIGESTEIAGGLRQIKYTSSNALIVNGTTLSTTGQDDKKLIYSASIKHEFTPELMVYASTGSSWRPGINVVGDFNLAPSALEDSFVNLPPEESKSYEIGFKSSLFDRRVRFNVTAYHQKFKNYPFRAPGNGVYFVNTTSTGQEVALFNFVGPVPVTVNGVEADVAFDVNSNWNVSLVASYSLGKVKNGNVPCNDINGDGVPDVVTTAPTLAQLQAAVGANNLASCAVTQRSSILAPFSATLQSEYRLPISDKVDGFLRGLFNYSGKSQGDPANGFDSVSAYGLLNLYTGIRDPEGSWELTFFGKNLFNTVKVLSRTDPLFTPYRQLGFAGQFANGRPVFTGPTSETFTSTYTGISTTPVQEFGLSLKYRFGSR